jgi:glycerophosphoryl diester phosphodiesterase
MSSGLPVRLHGIDQFECKPVDARTKPSLPPCIRRKKVHDVIKSRFSKPLIVIAVVASVLGASIGPKVRVWAGERYASGRPAQFFSWSVQDRANGYGHVVGIGHNAGDDPGSTLTALSSGAGYIEIDVVYQDGVLFAAHGQPQDTFRNLVWRLAPPVTLLDAWGYSSASPGIELDIKSGSPEALRSLGDFIKRHWSGKQQLMLASKSPDVLSTMADLVPGAFRVLSIDTPSSLASFQAGNGKAARADGVTVRDSLLNPESMASFKKEGLLVLAWTVEDPTRLDQLIDLGVDGVATDNLAITERLRGGAFSWSR